MIRLTTLMRKCNTRDILVGATPGLGVMFPMSKRHEILGQYLIIYAKSCIEGHMIGEIRHPHQV